METPLPSISQLTPNPTSSAAISTAIPPPLKPVTLPPSPIDGSPRAAVSTDTGANSEPLAPKLRLMCSFGGHIMPRPHDKALTYCGGETRLVVVDRRASLASLRSRLSSMLLNGRSFTLKYQLPSEDLDSLVTITTDEDLENMVEECDRATQRIRLFLFADKLETAATMGSLLDGVKSETWYVDALNQAGFLPRGFSDSAAVNNTLVNLDEASGGEAEIQNLENNNVGGENSKRGDVISHQEMQMSSMPDSPMMEAAGSSIGSSSSSPSTANLPPIRVRVSEDQRIEEQFAQMSFSNVQTQRHVEDGIGLMATRPTVINPSGLMVDPATGYNNAPVDGGSGAVSNGQVSPEDDRSDQGVSAGYKKPPLPMQPVVIPSRTTGGNSLTSPDSAASDTSFSSANSFSKPMYHQDQAPVLPRIPMTQPETTSVQTSHIPLQPETPSAQTTSHVLSRPVTYPNVDQLHQSQVQQPIIHQGVQYIPYPSQYIPFYSHQQQNYPVYMMSVPQSQQFVPAGTPPLYPNSKPTTGPEATQNLYHAPVSQNPPQVIQLQQHQQHQYMGYTGVPQHTTNANSSYSAGVPQHTTNANSSYSTGVPQHTTNVNTSYSSGVPQHTTNANANYGGAYEYTNSPNEQVYYHAQPPGGNTAIPLASPYQSMTPAAAATALADMSKQMTLDGGKQQQHMAAPHSRP